MEEPKTKEELEKAIEKDRGLVGRKLEKETELILTNNVELSINDLSVSPETIAALRDEVEGAKGFVREILKSGDYREGEIACKKAILELQELQNLLKEQGMAYVHCKAVEGWLISIALPLEAMATFRIKLNALTVNGGDSGKERF